MSLRWWWFSENRKTSQKTEFWKLIFIIIQCGNFINYQDVIISSSLIDFMNTLLSWFKLNQNRKDERKRWNLIINNTQKSKCRNVKIKVTKFVFTLIWQRTNVKLFIYEYVNVGLYQSQRLKNSVSMPTKYQ